MLFKIVDNSKRSALKPASLDFAKQYQKLQIVCEFNLSMPLKIHDRPLFDIFQIMVKSVIVKNRCAFILRSGREKPA